MNRKKIISVVGARPNFMKLAPIERELIKYRKTITHKIIHTGQHYDHKLSQIFFRDLDLPRPEIFLGAGSGSHAEQTAKIMYAFEKVIVKEKPDLVIVYGDVNSTLACAVVCSKMHQGNSTIPVAHVESGLRSFDRSMPEEVNRIVTDNLSNFLFVTEKAGMANLLKEGIERKKIYLSGDTMIDSLIHFSPKFKRSNILKKLGLKKNFYALATIHRPVNVDIKRNLQKITAILNNINNISNRDNFKIVFPVHPRTLKMMSKFGIQKEIEKIKNLLITEPAGYTDFIRLLNDCRFVITDSGGIQEEATFLKVPCLTLRDSFERPETIEIGSNSLCGLNAELVTKKVNEIFNGKYKKGKVPKLMDGNASKRILNVLLNNI